MKNKNEKFFALKSVVKLVSPMVAAIFLLTVALFFYILPTIEKNLIARKQDTIRDLVEIAHSKIAKFHEKEKAGKMSRMAAQKEAIETLQTWRYGPESKDYFWINDYFGHKMVMHPYRSDLDGKEISDLTDPNGKKIFLEFAKTVKESGEGFVDYMWQWKDDSSKIVPKISFVKGFEPWEWIVGTGIYINDVTAEISQITQKIIFANTVILLVITGLLIISVWLEIKAQKKSAEKIFQSEKKYQDLMDSVPVGVYSGEPGVRGKLLMTNKALAKMLGFCDESEMIGRQISKIYVNEGDRKKISDKILRNGKIVTETKMRKRNGEEIWVAVRSKLVKLGRKKFFNGIIEDITKQKVAEQKLKKSFKKLQELTKIKDHVFSVATHELRTPLTIIKMNAEILLDEDISEETKNQIRDIRDSAERLITIINDMLDLSRIESGKMSQMEMEKIDLKKMATEIEKNFTPLAKKKNISVKAKLIKKDLPPVVFNESKLRQIFNNLVGNALKYAGENVEVEIDAHHKNDKLEIHVADNGRGIAPHMHDKIFEKFGMIEHTEEIGTGLGLAFCKEIIEMVGERIWVESDVGRGARFVFTLAVG